MVAKRSRRGESYYEKKMKEGREKRRHCRMTYIEDNGEILTIR
jgi:hypothetical protein